VRVRRAGLGKGLGALIPTEGMRDLESSLQEIPLNLIEPNPNQPRENWDEEALSELAASIRELGILQPILVRTVGDDRYQIVAGERRWRAAHRAGLATVPAVIRDVDEATSVEHALVENLQREDLNPLEEATAYQQLIEDFQLTHDDIAKRVGRSRAAVTNTLRLLQLPPSVRHLVADNRLSSGHARALLGTPDRALQETLAQRALEESWTVRAVEDAIREAVSTPSSPDEPLRARRPSLRPPGLLELEELLSDHLDTRVRVTMSAKRGKVVIEFATLEDLERIYRVISEPPAPA
jgi:ParB family transcriptional regulator, chromosome partitioning protein